MTPQKWRFFWILLVVFVVTASLMIYDQGGFRSMNPGGLGILLLAFAAVAAVIYFFVKETPDDT